MYRNQVYIQTPEYDKGYALCIEHSDKSVCTAFKNWCFYNLPYEFRAFLQSNCDDFKMFEFWTDFDNEKADELFELGQAVADFCQVEFELY